jgi:hypothetical protein
MSKEDIRRINRLLKVGVLPIELDFVNISPNDQIDWEKVAYNTFYKTQEYFVNKFPPGLESLPGWEKMVDKMISNAKSPLEEIEERQNQQNEKLKIEIENISLPNIDEQN